MSVKLCKYGCNTPILWHKRADNSWEPREADGRYHDRVRCESLRPAAAEDQQQQTQVKIPSMGSNPIVSTSTVQISKEEWEKAVELLTRISHNVALMEAHYEGLVEQQRQLTRLLTRPLDEKAQQAELQYDTDREEGFVA